MSEPYHLKEPNEVDDFRAVKIGECFYDDLKNAGLAEAKISWSEAGIIGLKSLPKRQRDALIALLEKHDPNEQKLYDYAEVREDDPEGYSSIDTASYKEALFDFFNAYPDPEKLPVSAQKLLQKNLKVKARFPKGQYKKDPKTKQFILQDNQDTGGSNAE